MHGSPIQSWFWFWFLFAGRQNIRFFKWRGQVFIDIGHLGKDMVEGVKVVRFISNVQIRKNAVPKS
jgi:hypothetical protein